MAKVTSMDKVDKSGNLITAQKPLLNLYLEEAKHHMRHRKIEPKFEFLEKLKNKLWQERYKSMKKINCDEWNEKNIENILKSLKSNKTRDPKSWTNELFQLKNIGSDLKKAILKMSNLIKNEHKIPLLLKYANITAIYKNKGSRFNLENDRFIFQIGVLRSIVDKLIYKDKYESIDQHLPDTQIGARRGKNIRNHLFIVYGIINSVIHKDSGPIDINVYDIKQAFDSIWLEEAMNDLYESVGEEERDDKLALIYLNNRDNLVNTPSGQTDRSSIKDIVLQGSVHGPILCRAQMGRLGQLCEMKGIHQFLYMNLVQVMNLQMVDDILDIQLCGFNSVASNTFINTQIEMKRLILHSNKCKQIHVGKEYEFCPLLKAHGNDVKVVTEDKYLGDIISSTLYEEEGSNNKNIKYRKSTGIGIASQIMTVLQSVSLGYFYFEMAKLLRESMMVNGTLFNSEVWYGLTQYNVADLEEADKVL